MKTYQKPLFEVVDVMANTPVAALLPVDSEIILKDDPAEDGE